MRVLSLAFGLLMVAAGAVQGDGVALVAAAAALVAVVVGLVSRVSATLAVVATAAALALSAPSPVLAALAGVSATVYLVLRHSRARDASALTIPTVLGALGLSAAVVLGTAVPLALPWVPLVAPLAVVVLYVLAVNQYVD
ncbi:MAG: hypothetical protein ABW001_15890 [Mycobacterium sp.]